MNNKLTMLLAAGALVVGAAQSRAVTMDFSDADTYGAVTGTLIPGASINGNFDISNPDGTSSFTVDAGYGALGNAGHTFNSSLGFNPATDLITPTTGGTAFWVRSAGNGGAFLVTMDDLSLTGGNQTYNYSSGNGLTLLIDADLQADGNVNWTIKNTSANTTVTLDYAFLEVLADREVSTTPDGGATAMLLGLGGLGLAGLRRKLS